MLSVRVAKTTTSSSQSLGMRVILLLFLLCCGGLDRSVVAFTPLTASRTMQAKRNRGASTRAQASARRRASLDASSVSTEDDKESNGQGKGLYNALFLSSSKSESLVEQEEAAILAHTSRSFDTEQILEFMIPFLAPALAFVSYETISSGFADWVDAIADRNWAPVDGGRLVAEIISPAINGLVAPCIAFLFSTLTSTTISTMRERQGNIRQAINLEAGELRNLGQLIYSIPNEESDSPELEEYAQQGLPGVQDQCRELLIQYTSRIIRECNPRSPFEPAVDDPGHGMDTELNGMLLVLHQTYDNPIPSHLCDEAFGSIARLREFRMTRFTALQSTFPPLHYILLAVLALAECFVFLIETNQDLLFFLNALQLRILWTMLISVYVACFAVFYDFSSPFAGFYDISSSVTQLFELRRYFRQAATHDSTTVFQAIPARKSARK